MRISIGDSCYPPSSQAVYDKPMSDKEEDGVFKRHSRLIEPKVPPDTNTAEDLVHNDLEFLDDPSHAEEDGAPAAVYDKPMSDKEEDGVFKFDPPGIVFQSVYTMSLYGTPEERPPSSQKHHQLNLETTLLQT